MIRNPEWWVYITSDNTIQLGRHGRDNKDVIFDLEVETGLVLVDVEKRTISQPLQVKVIA